MKNSLFSVATLLFLNFACSEPVHKELNVMSFNIWGGGGKSIEATSKVLVESNADIIGIQESSRNGVNVAVRLADSLGWNYFSRGNSTSIISKYAIIDTSSYGYGVKIQITPKQSVWVFNIHLIYCPYEPYQLNGIKYCGAPILSTTEEALESAWNTRGTEVLNVIRDIIVVQKEGCPVFLTGDFNEPSCLDWTGKAVEAGLCKAEVAWPSTKAFIDQGGMMDSYRTMYPDEVAKPGHTWTPRPEETAYKEVLDRIDFVMFRGKIELINSQIIGENSPLSDIKFEDYPSDHRAVISTFKIF